MDFLSKDEKITGKRVHWIKVILLERLLTKMHLIKFNNLLLICYLERGW